MAIDATADHPRMVPLVVDQRHKRKTPLARRRRLNQLIRELGMISVSIPTR
jgi:hypothetical protein